MKKLFLPAGLLLGLFLGCATLVDKAGEALENSLNGGAQYEAYALFQAHDTEARLAKGKAGERFIIITLTQFPTVKFIGTEPNADGVFFLTSMDYLGGSPHGWNEFSLEIFGEGLFLQSGLDATLSIAGGLEQIEIKQGRIRRFETRITGSDAQQNLKARRERIQALAEWMAGMDGPRKGLGLKDFESYWKPIALPETVPKKKRPAGWQEAGDAWVRADGINWNTSYTERVFPKELWPVRNSATLLRDWEEALDWVYNEYNWPMIMEKLAGETVLTRKL